MVTISSLACRRYTQNSCIFSTSNQHYRAGRPTSHSGALRGYEDGTLVTRAGFSWWEACGPWWEAWDQWHIWDFRKGLAIELQGFKN